MLLPLPHFKHYLPTLLSRIWEGGGKIDHKQILAWVIDISIALRYLFANNLIHPNLKLGSIHIDSDGRLGLCGFFYPLFFQDYTNVVSNSNRENDYQITFNYPFPAISPEQIYLNLLKLHNIFLTLSYRNISNTGEKALTQAYGMHWTRSLNFIKNLNLKSLPNPVDAVIDQLVSLLKFSYRRNNQFHSITDNTYYLDPTEDTGIGELSILRKSIYSR